MEENDEPMLLHTPTCKWKGHAKTKAVICSLNLILIVLALALRLTQALSFPDPQSGKVHLETLEQEAALPICEPPTLPGTAGGPLMQIVLPVGKPFLCIGVH